MFSLHLTGSLWFLCLLPPGLVLLWRQYLHSAHGPSGKGADAAGPSYGGILLFGLQALALLLLTLSLTAPELRRHRVEFHNPAVLILRDQSGSFRDGGYLGLGGAYAGFEKKLVETYRARKFDVRVADFDEWARPVSGFGRTNAPGNDADGHADKYEDASERLTSLDNAEGFIDSAAIPNLQAVFLFSDGRANIDSGNASRTWSAPLFPVIFDPDSIAEIQPGQVNIAVTPGKQSEVSVAYSAVGAAKGTKGADAVLRLVQDGKTLLTRKLPIGGGSGVYRFGWTPDKSLAEGASSLKAILQPAFSSANFDPFNDTVAVAFPGGRSRKNIYVLRPLRGLDEKGMIDILSASDDGHVSFFTADELEGLKLTAADQIWIEAGALPRQGRLSAAVEASAAKAVVYVRPGSDGGGREFTPDAEIKVSKTAAEAFPDEVVRLKGITSSALEAPSATQGLAPLVEITEGAKHGLLMARMSLSARKRALFFLLPRIWNELFDPQADFVTRNNISAYIRAARILADLDDGAIRVTRPARVYGKVPFDVGFRIPESVTAGPKAALHLTFAPIGAAGKSFEPQQAGGSADEPEWKAVSLSRGGYSAKLSKGGNVLWSDTMEAAAKASLELSRIGFDKPALEEAAARSGGRVIDGVTSTLPGLPAAQIRAEKTQAFRIYNTLPLFILTLLLLSLSWLLRKKWDLD